MPRRPEGLNGMDPRLLEIVELACRTPSVHNSQPWRWRVDDAGLHLFADFSRQLDRTDPDGRDLMISCGAAVHHLQVAAAAHGRGTTVRRMPDPFNDAHLAAITLHPQPPSPEAVAAGRAIAQRTTDRRRPTSWPVPPERLADLSRLAESYGALAIPVLTAAGRIKLTELLDSAELDQQADPGYRAELRRWTSDGQREGVPATNRPARPTVDAPFGPERDRFPAGSMPEHPAEATPAESVMTVLCTSSDDSLSRLRAGEALSAILLQGTVDGLAIVPLSRSVEVEATRRVLREEMLQDRGSPQLVLRIGWPPATRTPVPQTPRRPLNEVLSWRSAYDR